MYILMIRVGQEYYPVQWAEGRVCWNKMRKPSVFAASERGAIQDGLDMNNFKWERY